MVLLVHINCVLCNYSLLQLCWVIPKESNECSVQCCLLMNRIPRGCFSVECSVFLDDIAAQRWKDISKSHEVWLHRFVQFCSYHIVSMIMHHRNPLMMSSQCVSFEWTNQQAPGRIWMLSIAMSPEYSPPRTPRNPIWKDTRCMKVQFASQLRLCEFINYLCEVRKLEN